MTMQTNKRFRLPHRTAVISFEGTDFDGAEVRVRRDVPIGKLIELQEMSQAEERRLEVYKPFGDAVLESWNLQTEAGEDMPANGEGMTMIPPELANIIVLQWTELVTNPPGPLGQQSGDGSTSKAGSIPTVTP